MQAKAARKRRKPAPVKAWLVISDDGFVVDGDESKDYSDNRATGFGCRCIPYVRADILERALSALQSAILLGSLPAGRWPELELARIRKLVSNE